MATRRPFLRETWQEKVFRHRGVIAVISVPVLLIMLVMVLMPRAAINDDMAPVTTNANVPATSQPALKYAVVLDAGSTGSRVHTYRFRHGSQDLELIDDTFKQLKPGLSSFKDDPAAGGASLAPLLESAKAIVPKAQSGSTPIELRATAGLRLLPADAADELLEAAKSALQATPFSVAPDSVTIMDGADEGAYQWITINYLLGRLGGPPGRTVATVDLGGGSVQMAYALPQNAAAAAPKGYVRTLRGGGAAYHVYVHSYLGFGLMAARAAVLDAAAEADGHPCVIPGVNTSYKYAGTLHEVKGRSGTVDGAFDVCSATVQHALHKDKECGEGAAAECAFDGVWGGGGTAESELAELHLSSYFFDRAQQAGLVDGDAVSGRTTPAAFGKAAAKACGGGGLADSLVGFVDVSDSDAPYLCMDLTFCFTLLTHGFGMGPSATLTLVKQVSYKGNLIEAAWPLGAAINSIG